MPPETWRAYGVASAGGTIIFIGRAPEMAPGLTNQDRAHGTLANIIAGCHGRRKSRRGFEQAARGRGVEDSLVRTCSSVSAGTIASRSFSRLAKCGIRATACG